MEGWFLFHDVQVSKFSVYSRLAGRENLQDPLYLLIELWFLVKHIPYHLVI